MTALATVIGMSRVGLNKALPGEGHPALVTVLQVAKIFDLKVAFGPPAAKLTG